MAMGIAASCVATEPFVLDNGVAAAEISPEIGRITGWKLRGGENVLWNNPSDNLSTPYVPGWKNYGGDKVWLVPQKMREAAFGGPAPDPVIDGQPWRVTAQSARSITIESGESDFLRCRVSRVITLDETEPVLTVTTTVSRVAASPVPVEIWTVSQAKRPEFGLVDLAADFYPGEPRFRQMCAGRSNFQPIEIGPLLKVPLPPKGWDKFSAYGRFVESVYSGAVFRQEFEPQPDGAYPERSTVHLYVNDDYVEMECFSPLRHLKAGESMTLAVRWSLRPRDGWRQTGPGGGGRTMHLQTSPSDASQLLCAGDMGAIFRSSDGGKHWMMNDFEQAERVRYGAGCSPWEFVPARPGEVWTGSKTRGLLRSPDNGATWRAVPGPWDSLTHRDWFHSLGPDLVRFAPDGRTGLAAWGAFGDDRTVKLFLTRDAGTGWAEIPLPAGTERPMALHFTGKDRALYLGSTQALSIDLKQGAATALPLLREGTVVSSATGGDSLFVVLRREDKTTGLYEVGRDPETWNEIPFAIDGRTPAISVIACDRMRGSTLYAGVRGQTDHPATIWKSSDRGRSWREILFRKPGTACNIGRNRWTTGRWGWSTAPASIAVDWNDPETVGFTDFTMCGLSRNGGADWDILSTGPMEGGRIPGGGTPMLTGWNYLIDGGRHLVSSTDFTTWQSRDRGESWEFNQPEFQAIWHNNVYEIAVDPVHRERLYAAASLKHDLPYWHHLITQGSQPRLWRGGLLVSEDGGRNWNAVKPETSGLPDLPLTGLRMDDDGTLYAASMGGGVFRRKPGKTAFEPFSAGLPEENRNVHRVTRSPGGALYAVVTAKWETEKQNALPGGVFRYDPAAARWVKLPLPPEVVYPVNVSFSEDGSQLLIACFQQWRERERTGSGAYAAPGLWQAAADGSGARKLLDGLPVYEAKFRPGHPGEILAGTVGGGLMRGRDNDFQRVPGCPPGSVHNIVFDPADPDAVSLTTFGQGIWKGKVE